MTEQAAGAAVAGMGTCCGDMPGFRCVPDPLLGQVGAGRGRGEGCAEQGCGTTRARARAAFSH